MIAGLGIALALVAAVPPTNLLEPATPADRDAPQPDEVTGATALARAIEARTPAAQIDDLDRALAALPRPTRFRGLVQCQRGWTLHALDRRSESDTAYEECYRLRPDDPYALWGMSSIVLDRGDLRRGVRLLLAAIKADPTPLADYHPGAMESTLRRLAYAREHALRAELIAALAQSSYGKDDPAWSSRQARDAIDDLLAAEKPEDAVKLLPLILVPRIGLGLMVDRRYEAIWPDVERWAGGDLTAQRDAYVAAAKAAFDVDPSLVLRRNYATALTAAGRSDEARALLAQAVADPALWDEDRWDIVLTAIRLSGMLEAEGETDAALAVLRRMKAAAPTDKHDYAANIMPNEARLLIGAGRHGEALALLDAEPPPAEVEDPAALGFYRALRACALRGLGRTDEATVLAATLASQFATNLAAQRLAGTCGSPTNDANAQWIESVRSPETRSSALVAWLESERTAPASPFVDDEWTVAPLARDPGARELFERFGRRLPPSFDEALAGWTARPAASNR